MKQREGVPHSWLSRLDSIKFAQSIVGATGDDFIKYPRTPDLLGSKDTENDKYLAERNPRRSSRTRRTLWKRKSTARTWAITSTRADGMVIHRGATTADELRSLIGLSAYDSAFDNPLTGQTDHLMERLYLCIEDESRVKRQRPSMN